MKATITIKMDNAAFDNPSSELARIFRVLAIHTENSCAEIGVWPTIAIRDINGNRVGQMEIKP
jgi:hypothetical protein